MHFTFISVNIICSWNYLFLCLFSSVFLGPISSVLTFPFLSSTNERTNEGTRERGNVCRRWDNPLWTRNSMPSVYSVFFSPQNREVTIKLIRYSIAMCFLPIFVFYIVWYFGFSMDQVAYPNGLGEFYQIFFISIPFSSPFPVQLGVELQLL